MVQWSAFAAGVLPNIYAFYRYTRSSPYLCHPLVRQSPLPPQGWAVVFDLGLAGPPAGALRPIIPDNACIPRLTAAAGTELADAYSLGTVTVLSQQKGFTNQSSPSPTRHRSVRLSPIAEDSPLLPPGGVWAVSQSQCGWSFSQTSY